jgi:hypothetical protein
MRPPSGGGITPHGVISPFTRGSHQIVDGDR